jgi:hypothetical protein
MKGFVNFITIVLFFVVVAFADSGRAGNVLIGVHVNGESRAWWNPGPTYKNAFVAAGASVEVVYAPEDGSIPFPDPFTPHDYPVCVILTSENWLEPPSNFGPTEEGVLSDYCDAGGAVMIVGQDLLYGAHYYWGPASGFFRNCMGLSYVNQDILKTSNSVAWTGESGGPLNGMSGVTSNGNPWPPFLANLCAADELDPVAGANVLIRCTAGSQGPYATGIYYDRPTGRTIRKSCFVAYELAADSVNFDSMIGAIYDWFTTDTGVEPASLGKLKAVYK